MLIKVGQPGGSLWRYKSRVGCWSGASGGQASDWPASHGLGRAGRVDGGPGHNGDGAWS